MRFDIGHDTLLTLRDTLLAYAQYARALWLAAMPHKFSRRTAVRHIAILAWEFPPHISGGVYRPAALARYARRAGYEVTVFAESVDEPVSPAGLKLLEYVGSDVTVLRVSPPTLRPSYSYFPRIDSDFCSALDMFDCAYATLSERVPDTVVSTGPPFHDFVTGYLLARAFNSRLVLDYRDEWTVSPFDFVKKGKDDLEWELRCLGAADLIVLTTESQRAHLIDR